MKTLKDLEHEQLVNTFRLRSLAKEWVKQINAAESNKFLGCPKIDGLFTGCDEYGCDNLANWIEHFFNLEDK